MNTRKRYSKEFKLDAIGLVTDHGYKITDAAKSLGIKPNLLSRWIKESKDTELEPFRGNGKLRAEQVEIRRLREEVKRLTMEKEILKKATVFFIKETK